MSKLSVGIVGLPNVGKSTLFNALTKQSVTAANYPFATIDPNVGIVPVPDERLDKLAALSQSKKVVPAIVEFVDIAGLVKGAAEGEGLGNKFLQNIREVDAIAEMVRTFKDDDVIHVSGKVDPLSDIEVINLELVLSDEEAVSKRLNAVSRDAKTGKKEAVAEATALEKVLAVLKEGKLASTAELTEEERKLVKSLQLLTMKPILYILNTSEAAESVADEVASKIPGNYVKIDPVFGTGLDDLIKESYKLLDLITFFTTGESESRAWTTKRNATAPEAGRSIHSDFQTRFIRAEVIENEKLLEAGSYPNARAKGWVRTEGKEYVVQDGDVIEFLV